VTARPPTDVVPGHRSSDSDRPTGTQASSSGDVRRSHRLSTVCFHPASESGWVAVVTLFSSTGGADGGVPAVAVGEVGEQQAATVQAVSWAGVSWTCSLKYRQLTATIEQT